MAYRQNATKFTVFRVNKIINTILLLAQLLK